MKRSTAIITSVVFVLILLLCMVYVSANQSAIATAYAGVESAEDTFEAARFANAQVYGVLTILPPLVAIGLAFVTKNVVVSLGAGVFMGTFLLSIVNNTSFFQGFLSIFKALIAMIPLMIEQMADSWNAGVLLQVLTIGGMIAVITRLGGAQAIANAVAKLAKSVRSTTIATWLMGIVIFFDDYANSLIVGPMMRPVSDKNGISREKLAFVVDATAAPVAGIAVISTWISTELSAIRTGYAEIGMTVGGYDIFLDTIPFRFYNIFMLAFILIIAFTGRDFGPMLKAEVRARRGAPLREGSQVAAVEDELGEVDPNGSIWSAIVPIATLIIVAFVAFYLNGREALGIAAGTPFSFELMRDAFGEADAAFVLFLAAAAASVVAVIMGLVKKTFKLEEGVNTWIKGVKSLVITGIILMFAWSLTGAIKALGTNLVISRLVSEFVPYALLPSLIFIIGSLISFATGTSYGTMLILTPLTIPAAHGVLQLQAVPFDPQFFMYACIGAVLSGAIFGDHCSPISDTTILSSMGASCDHMDHVRTQMPYALFIAGISVVFGYMLSGFGLSVWLTLAIGLVAVYAILRFAGKDPSKLAALKD